MNLNPTSFKLEYSEEDNSLFSGNLQYDRTFRRLSELKPVLLDEEFVTASNGSQILYTMFRNSIGPGHTEIFEKNKIRYDVTVIESYNLGRELCKTFGHYHPLSQDGMNSYPEMYEVIEGEASFLLQKEAGNNITEAKIVNAVKNDKVIIPPGYGHISVNTGRGKLVLSNLVSSQFKSDYSKIKEKHGGAVYTIAEGSLIQNPHYHRITVSRYDAPEISWIDNKSSLYDQFIDNPELFAFLNSPALLPH